MNKILLKALLVVLIIVPCSFAHGDSSYLSRYEKSRMPNIKPPRINIVVLENGIRCFLVEDHTLPIIKLQAIVRAGSIYDPSDKVGLSMLTSSLLRGGGTKEMTPDQFDKAIDELGATFTSGSDRELGYAYMSILSEDLKRSMKLFTAMLFEPRFDSSRLRVERLDAQESLRREKDNPWRLAAIDFKKFVYGKDSPWARRPSAKSIRSISADDLRDFHNNFFRSSNVIIAASGDFKSKDMIETIRAATSKAPGGEVAFPEVPAVELAYTPGYENVKKDIPQSFIRIGQLSIKRDNPDKYALYVLSDILGGGFKSRLVEDVRTNRGLAYRINSNISSGEDYGLFSVGVSTKATQAAGVVDIVKEHIRRIAEDADVTKQELDFAKNSILTKLIFSFDSAFKVASRRAHYFIYGYPDNYWKKYRDEISAVSKNDISRVSHKYIHPDGLKTLVVGPSPYSKKH
jgi:zinc protease